MNITELERRLRALLDGEYSSINITYNDHHACYRKSHEGDKPDGDFDHVDWVSEEEHRRAMRNDSVWIVRWYPNTPVGFYSVGASTLQAVLKTVLKHAGQKSEGRE